MEDQHTVVKFDWFKVNGVLYLAMQGGPIYRS